jgi:hypothetical protein
MLAKPRTLGNTSSASLPISLDEANRAGRLKPSDLVAMMAVGAGMTWAVPSCGGRWALAYTEASGTARAARWSVRFLAFAGPHTDTPSSRWLLPWL